MGKKSIDKSKLIFSNHDLKVLLIPLMIEQLLNALMGTVDTIMVSNVGSAAISAVSLVDSINNLMLQVFAALAAGGTIVCSQYLGKKEPKECNRAARQVFLTMLVISILIMVFCLIFRYPLLHVIFGQVEPDVMEAAQTYFFLTALSYPFIALFNANASFFQAEGNTRLPMTVSVICNCVNIAGNSVMIFGFGWGVFGAALSTLVSRILMAVIMMCFQRRDRQVIVIRNYAKIRPDFALIKPLVWVMAFIPAYGLRAAGDVKFSMTVSTISMWVFRVALCIYLCRVQGFGPIAVWIGMFVDWTVRGIIFGIRFKSRKWLRHHLV